MTKRHGPVIGALVVAAIAAAGSAYFLTGSAATLPKTFAQTDRPPKISPDYAACVIPPNIAPLNFLVNEVGRDYRAAFHGPTGETITVGSRDGTIVIDPDQWRGLLQRNRGGQIQVDVYVRGADEAWARFQPITNRVAPEPIDPYVVYRLISGPNHNHHAGMATYQRHIETFKESLVVLSRSRCVNCHTFNNNDPDKFLMHMREKDNVAMILADQGRLTKFNTRTRLNSSPAAYSSWHPSGKLIAFSVNKVKLLHKTAGESRDAIDYASDLGVYLIESNTIVGTSKISDPDRREAFPCWSPDGRYLYFASGAKPWAHGIAEKLLPRQYDQLRYDLMRISYDVDTGQWGELETVLSGEEVGKTLLEPRISPNGKYLLFTAADYGGFPVYLNSDLYLMDLTSGRYWPLTETNSDQTDSWHSWSSNGRWIAFASKRRDHLLARLYFSYVDAEGRAHKAVLLPQRDPRFYDDYLKIYNVPELITGPITITPREFLRAIDPSKDIRDVDVVSGATPGIQVSPPGSEVYFPQYSE